MVSLLNVCLTWRPVFVPSFFSNKWQQKTNYSTRVKCSLFICTTTNHSHPSSQRLTDRWRRCSSITVCESVVNRHQLFFCTISCVNTFKLYAFRKEYTEYTERTSARIKKKQQNFFSIIKINSILFLLMLY